jgi:hypothetical protein
MDTEVSLLDHGEVSAKSQSETRTLFDTLPKQRVITSTYAG